MDAIHPGYGFLSENAEFCKKVKDEKIVWIGPDAETISLMGDKINSKNFCTKENIPTLQKTSKVSDAKKIGFPILVKASAGGGGKGMRIVKTEKELKDAVIAAKREAKSSFDDDRVFLEKYIEHSRHIEVQILGDNFGNVIHLGERECSIQRRHQKIIEESPSSRLTNKIREDITSAAVKLGKKLNYKSAGTVEFLFDEDTNEFWFLEVNTRLQVEHPVTEEVTGIDLVKEQIKIASGKKLDFLQEDIEFNGHAIEARLYAENPENNLKDWPRVWISRNIGNYKLTRPGVNNSWSIVSRNVPPPPARQSTCLPSRPPVIQPLPLIAFSGFLNSSSLATRVCNKPLRTRSSQTCRLWS